MSAKKIKKPGKRQKTGKAQKRQRFSDNIFTAIFDASPESMAITRVVDRHLVDINPGFTDLTGYTPKDIVGKTTRDLGIWANLKELDAYWSLQLKQGTVEDFPFTLRTRQGALKECLISGQLSRIDGQDHVIGIAKDVTEQKRADMELRKLKTAVEQAVEGCAIVDLDGNIQFLNAAFAQMHGYTAAEVIGKHLSVFHTPEQLRQDVEPFLEKVRAIGFHKGEVGHRRKDGMTFPVMMTVSMIKDEKGTPLVFSGMAHDITERKRAEQILRLSEEKYRLLVENLQEGIWQIDQDAVTRFVNPRMAAMLGYTVEEMLGKHLFAFMDDQGVKLAKLDLERRKQGISEQHEFEFLKKDGTRIYASLQTSPLTDGEGRYIGALAGVTDITESKQMEQELVREHALLRTVIDNLPFRVYAKDLQHRFFMGNKATLQEMGLASADELIGKTDFDFYRRSLAEAFFADEEKIIKTGQSLLNKEETWPLASGDKAVSLTSKVLLRDSQTNTAIGIVGINRDITESKRLEEALRNSQKLESLAVLAGGIAHDFNNLHVGMFGFIELANASCARNQPEQAREYIVRALSVFERARALTRQLMTFAKSGETVRKIQPLAQIIRKSAQFALSGSNSVCHFDLADDLWMCDCDENQIGQVIDNIVINSQQAMPQGGVISLIAENVMIAPSQAGALRPGGDYVRISIKDHGVGISAEILARIFDPFFTTKSIGHGLGLSTAYSIIKAHGGWIDAESEPGKGSAFYIFIPAAKRAAIPAANDAPVKHTGAGCILIMDDEDFIRKVVSDVLENMNYTAVQARNGEEAVELFGKAEKNGQPFAAAILDLTIPGGMGGQEAAREILKINPRAVVIAMSGYSDGGVMSNPADHGFAAGLCKPFQISELAALLNRIFTSKT